MKNQRIEIVEIATGVVVHVIPCPGEIPGTGSMAWLLRGVLGNIGRFNYDLTRGVEDGPEDNRLDTDRYFAREASS